MTDDADALGRFEGGSRWYVKLMVEFYGVDRAEAATRLRQIADELEMGEL